MKIALVYDWVTTQYGGAEQVLLALHEIFPEAPLFTSIYDPQQTNWAKVFKVKTSWLQKIPRPLRHHRWLALWLPLAFEQFDLSKYEVVISVTSFAAKGILTRPEQLHICYLLTPPRYLHTHEQEYLGHWIKKPIIGKLAQKFLGYLKRWDVMAASRPDLIIPISQLVANRVKNYYHRSTEPVIYPPVTIPKHDEVLDSGYQLPNQYLLVVSRLVGYKKIDLAIKACLKSRHNLIVVGDGPEKQRLQQLATHPANSTSPNSKIIFLGPVTNSELQNLYNGCTALLMPGEEDFGIIGLEALASGKPVVVYHHSGVAEIIKNYQHGIHLTNQNVESLITAINQLDTTHFSKTTLMNQAQKFSTSHFQSQFLKVINHQTQ